MKRYKATLFEQKVIDERAEPIDTILLDKKCYPTAEKLFFNKRGWERTEHLHIEIEDMPRFLA